jgi:hypothetical protein
MSARVASGTLAGSTSCSWASIRKGAASSDLPRFRRHPPGLAQLCRRRGARTSSSGTTSKPRKQQLEIGVTSVARFVLGEERPSEPPVVRQQPPVVGSAGGLRDRTARAGPTGRGCLPPPHRTVRAVLPHTALRHRSPAGIRSRGSDGSGQAVDAELGAPFVGEAADPVASSESVLGAG